MLCDRVMRGALWAAVVLNLIGVLLFVPPALGLAPQLLPIPAPRFFAAQVALTIALPLVAVELAAER